MSSKEVILQYKLCIKCNEDMAKLGSNYCKKCKIKPINSTVIKENKLKMYFYSFQDRNKANFTLNSSKYGTCK
jgi:hypothetical protein